MPDGNCASCRFYWPIMRQCRRFPPQNFITEHHHISFDKTIASGASQAFPRTDELDWCGEYQSKEEE